MGPLHIKKAILQCHGNLVKGTGLDDLLAAAGLKSIGLKTAMVDVNDIKKSRYSCQVMTPVLYSLLQDAYTEATNCPSNEIDKIKEWAKDQTSTSSNILLRNIGTFDKHPFVCQIFERSQPRSFRRYSWKAMPIIICVRSCTLFKMGPSIRSWSENAQSKWPKPFQWIFERVFHHQEVEFILQQNGVWPNPRTDEQDHKV